MARYKTVDSHLSKLLPVKFSEQILPGIFEYAVNRLVDHEIDLSVFDARYRNDAPTLSMSRPAVRRLGNPTTSRKGHHELNHAPRRDRSGP
jgi:hypothetical protein